MATSRTFWGFNASVVFVTALALGLSTTRAYGQCTIDFSSRSSKSVTCSPLDPLCTGPPFKPGDRIRLTVEVCNDGDDPVSDCYDRRDPSTYSYQAVGLYDDLALVPLDAVTLVSWDQDFWRHEMFPNAAGCEIDVTGDLSCATDTAFPTGFCTNAQSGSEPVVLEATIPIDWPADEALFCTQARIISPVGPPPLPGSEWGVTSPPNNLGSEEATCHPMEFSESLSGLFTVEDVTGNPDELEPGDWVRHTLCLNNDGGLPLHGLRVTDFLPVDEAFRPMFDTALCVVNITDDNPDEEPFVAAECLSTPPDLPYVEFSGFDLDPRERICITFEIRTLETLEYRDLLCSRAEAEWEGKSFPDVIGTPCIRIREGTDFSRSTQTVDPRFPSEHDPVRFTIEVWNTGIAEATETTLAEILPDSGLDLSTMTTHYAPDVRRAERLDGNVLTISFPDPIRPDASSPYTAVTLTFGLKEGAVGQYCNAATITSRQSLPAQTVDPYPLDPARPTDTCLVVRGEAGPRLLRGALSYDEGCPGAGGLSKDLLFPLADQGTVVLPHEEAGYLPGAPTPPGNSCFVLYQVEGVGRITVTRGVNPLEDVRLLAF